MCTNRDLVENLECYLEDLVDSFENFVKKSLILISVGVGSMLVILVYMLKELVHRTGTAEASAVISSRAVQAIDGAASNPRIRPIQERNTTSNGSKPKVTSTASNTDVRADPTCEKCAQKDFACRNREQKHRTGNCPSSRTSVPSLPTRLPNQNKSPSWKKDNNMVNKSSCCSLCCSDWKSNNLDDST